MHYSYFYYDFFAWISNKMSNIQNVLPYLQQFYCLVLIYDQQFPCPFPTTHPHTQFIIIFIIIINIYFFIEIFYFLKIATKQLHFLKRLKYTLDYMRGTKCLLQDAIKLTK